MFSLPFVEKYRPKILDDVVGNEDAIARLKVFAKHGNIPNLILSGPPGCGKTTTIECLIRQLLGKALASKAVLELNASDDRGIAVVRDKIKNFAQKQVTLPKGRHKLVILDEVDSMTSVAQQALRRTMEIYSSTTRFLLACNISSKVIEAIQSRCAIIRFAPLTPLQMSARLFMVAREEGVPADEGGIKAVLFTADGDMRHALNALQATAAGFGTITAENVFRVCDQPHPERVLRSVTDCLAGHLDNGWAILSALLDDGYSVADIYRTLYKVVLEHGTLAEGIRVLVLRIISDSHFKVTKGTETALQMCAMMSNISQIAAHQ
eukprot:gnl/Dysnectes_brevis/1313_a1472_1463.p1 GENE.gnl/Dysnectes_brevis/1313_a1472_1463~~gnl/Dysnectes_brevis/1313_a1472_1463.p1  ORF type:complete len:322 (-),score=103.77 gnl/Dysnectes_brevis/1313_a1472_1463:69-1034(-)